MNDTTDDTNVGEVEAPLPDAAALAEYLNEILLGEIKVAIERFAKLLTELTPAALAADPKMSALFDEARVAQSAPKEPSSPKEPREPREAIDDEAVAAAVGMVSRGLVRDVAPNVLLAAKRRGLVECKGRGRGAKYAVTPAGQEILAALAELDAAEEQSAEALTELAGLAAAEAAP